MITMFTTLFVIFVIYELNLQTKYIVSENVIVTSLLSKWVFFTSFFLIGIREFFKYKPTRDNLFTAKNFLIFSLIASLVFSIFNKDIGIYATGFYIFFVLVYFSVKQELFAINKVFYFVFLYAILEFVGTISTPKGFRFPEMSYSFYILPLSYSFFRLEKRILLRIMKVFFRIIFIYVAVSLVYWFFNFISNDISLTDWITKKMNINGVPIYDFITKWSNYTHPSYISLILFCAIISGFYLFYKKEESSKISLIELIIFIVGCLMLEFVMESRIGILESLAIVFLSAMYYIKMKTSYFKLSIIGVVITVIVLGLVVEKHFTGMMDDSVRKVDYTLAINYIKDHPFWGGGYHQQREVLMMQDIKMTDVTRPDGADKIIYTHNQFLGVMVQYGVFGLIVLIILLVALFSYAVKSRSYLLQMFMLIYLIFMFIEEPLSVQEGITRFMIFLSFFVAVSEANKVQKSFQLSQWFSKS